VTIGEHKYMEVIEFQPYQKVSQTDILIELFFRSNLTTLISKAGDILTPHLN